jgi:hypothetical protein
MSGYIVYEGPSMFDKQPIVAIVTMVSKNDKTGNMAQLWILRSDVEPNVAVKTGADQSVCGGCKHRPSKDNTCYVLTFQAPLGIYRAYKRGVYNNALPPLEGRELRIGAYGDAAMIPPGVIEPLLESADSYTGYTHQWSNKRLTHALKYCQGSVDSITEALEFKSKFPNRKYFRVTNDISDILPNEIECLADTKGITCKECMLCNGSKQDIVIEVHGQKAKNFKPDISVLNVN